MRRWLCPHRSVTSMLLVLVAACDRSASRASARPNPIVFIATKHKLEGPRTTSAGYAMLTFANCADSVMAHALLRIKDNVSTDSALHAARILLELEQGDSPSAMAAFDAFYGSALLVPPGRINAVGVVLPPGRYIAYANVVSDGRPRVLEGFIAPIEVTASRDPR